MQSVAGEVRAVSGAGRHLCGGDPVSLRVQSVAGEVRAVSGAGRHLCGGDPVSLRVQSVAGEVRAVSGAGRHLCGGDPSLSVCSLLPEKYELCLVLAVTCVVVTRLSPCAVGCRRSTSCVWCWPSPVWW